MNVAFFESHTYFSPPETYLLGETGSEEKFLRNPLSAVPIMLPEQDVPEFDGQQS